MTDNISVSLKVAIRRAQGTLPLPVRRLLWIPHDRYRYSYDDYARKTTQGWAYNAAGTGKARLVAREKNLSFPEVYRLYPAASFRMTDPFLRLLIDINPELDPASALSILNQGVAYCNTQTYLLDQMRICGGATVEELKREGGRVYFRTILTTQPVPNAADVLADKALWHWVTGVQPDGDINMVTRWNKGRTQRLPVRMLNISTQPVSFAVDEVLPIAEFVDPQTWEPG